MQDRGAFYISNLLADKGKDSFLSDPPNADLSDHGR